MKTMLLLLTVGTLALRAEEFSLAWSTIDGGGVQESTGGEFTLSATVGQPDAGTSAGGDFTLHSGFWAGITDEPGWTVPSLRLGWLAQQPTVFWPTTATNWTLESSANLVVPVWQVAATNPAVIGEEFATPVNPSVPLLHYRLRREP